jgi:hypothetical protein
LHATETVALQSVFEIAIGVSLLKTLQLSFNPLSLK